MILDTLKLLIIGNSILMNSHTVHQIKKQWENKSIVLEIDSVLNSGATLNDYLNYNLVVLSKNLTKITTINPDSNKVIMLLKHNYYDYILIQPSAADCDSLDNLFLQISNTTYGKKNRILIFEPPYCNLFQARTKYRRKIENKFSNTCRKYQFTHIKIPKLETALLKTYKFNQLMDKDCHPTPFFGIHFAKNIIEILKSN